VPPSSHSSTDDGAIPIVVWAFFGGKGDLMVLEHDGGSSGYCSLRILLLWTIRFSSATATIDALSPI
jgi:hypothetical protein